jgi:hypothetical protein
LIIANGHEANHDNDEQSNDESAKRCRKDLTHGSLLLLMKLSSRPHCRVSPNKADG